MHSAYLFQRLAEYGSRESIIWRDASLTYAQLLALVASWRSRLDAYGVAPGDCVAFYGDYCPDTIALLLALIQGGQVAVPLGPQVTHSSREALLDVAHVSFAIDFTNAGPASIERRHPGARHALFDALTGAGLVVFTTGSTGKSKAVLHDFERVLSKFDKPRPPLRSLLFLLLDHFGGINTLLHILSTGGTAIAIGERSPDAICAAIERHRAELLPASPTFLNMLLLSNAHGRHDLSNLKLITFGTEPMPMSTLRALRHRFPLVKLKQTYGLSEIAVIPTRSRDDESLFIKISGGDFEADVRNGTLRIRSRSAMLGYLNAPSPFDEDGWFDTQDEVQVEGDYLRILGRRSDVINVGGEKVFPAAVESVLLQLDNVLDAEVYGRRNAATSQVVAARLLLRTPEPRDALLDRVRSFCQGRLARHQIPLWVEVVDRPRHNERFKKTRH